MPQEFHALRCVECGTFQVHIVKKVAKWACKICQKKQSVLQEFARGSGKDCRLHVQRLNKLRLEQEMLPSAALASEDPVDLLAHDISYPQLPVGSEGLGSKWEKYLDEKKESSEEYQDLEPAVDDARVQRKRRSKQQSAPSTKKQAGWRDEAADFDDFTEPCVDVERPKRGWNMEDFERPKEVFNKENVETAKKCLVVEEVSRPNRGSDVEFRSKQVRGSDVTSRSKWAKYVDPADEDDANADASVVEGDEDDTNADAAVGEADEDDLDELLQL